MNVNETSNPKPQTPSVATAQADQTRNPQPEITATDPIRNLPSDPSAIALAKEEIRADQTIPQPSTLNLFFIAAPAKAFEPTTPS